MTPSAIFSAVRNARLPILSMAITYLVSVIAGIIMAHAGMSLAIDTRNRIVGQAYNGSNVTINALESGNRLWAALTDFGGNLIKGAIPITASGLGVIFPYPIVAYQGWIGGIVSVNGDGTSRFAHPYEALYYLVTLVAQLIPYTLAAGAGVHLGLEYYRQQSSGKIKWYQLPRQAVLDLGRIYLLVIPLFLAASLWEFFAVR
jgi:hypothetical protein